MMYRKHCISTNVVKLGPYFQPFCFWCWPQPIVTHTHTHIYIYVYIYIFACLYIYIYINNIHYVHYLSMLAENHLHKIAWTYHDTIHHSAQVLPMKNVCNFQNLMMCYAYIIYIYIYTYICIYIYICSCPLLVQLVYTTSL